MKKILILFIILPICCVAQTVDDFSDGDFTANPTWIGTDTSFKINNNFQLQSAGTEAGEAYLVIASEANPEGLTDQREVTKQSNLSCLGLGQVGFSPFGRRTFGSPRHFSPRNDEKEWRFWIRENFSPSANNYAEVWLCADTVALPNARRGYFLRFGAAGSQDAIELYRKDPQGEYLIAKGTDAAIASSFKVAVKVNRDSEGRWTVATDYDNMGNYTLEAEGSDNTYPVEGYFGFYLKFNSSNARKFYFDDIDIGPEIIDTEPPKLLLLEVLDT